MRNHIITKILLTTTVAWSVNATAAPNAPTLKPKPLTTNSLQQHLPPSPKS
jgi:hypothetical protein